MSEVSEARIEEIWNEIWGMLQKEEAEPAVARALRALTEDGDEPEFRYLLGISLVDLGELEGAIPEFERAAELSDDWADPYAGLAWSLFRLCRFEAAAAPIATAIEFDPEMADAYQLHGLLSERAGNDDVALVAFAEARRLDPEAYPDPVALDEEEFLAVARAAVEELDDRTKKVLEDAPLFVQLFPADELLTGDDPPFDPQILGLFSGLSLLEQSVQDSGVLPTTMYLFQRNLERMAESTEDLMKEIRITVLHEIAHQFGWTDEDLEEKGFG